MHRALFTSRTGMSAHQNKLDTLSNNLANSQTDGYKRMETSFESLLKVSLEARGVPLSLEPEGDAGLGTGARTGAVSRDWTQGVLVSDSDPLALALEGMGFFGVRDEGGTLLLTRGGRFALSPDGILVNEDGHPVAVEDMEDMEGLDPLRLEVTASGEILFREEDGGRRRMGRLVLYGPGSDMEAAGEGYFRLNGEAPVVLDPEETQTVAVRQGYVEKSNVDIGREMVDMMISQRAYQMNAKAVQAADDMWSLINNMKR